MLGNSRCPLLEGECTLRHVEDMARTSALSVIDAAVITLDARAFAFAQPLITTDDYGFRDSLAKPQAPQQTWTAYSQSFG